MAENTDVSKHLDTQVISYAMKGEWDESIKGHTICSIVANEFFRIQGSDPATAKIYIPLLSKYHMAPQRRAGIRNHDHPFGKHMTDSFIMDFGNEFPSIVEYNNLSIATAINDGFIDLMIGATNHLDKPVRKILKKQFQFLLDNEIRCVPLQESEVEKAFQLLSLFRQQHNPKKNFRNTWNDLLILSCAIMSGGTLVTEDNLLMRFIAENLGTAPVMKQKFIEIPFHEPDDKRDNSSRESKGYINTGWRVRFNKRPRHL